MNSTNAEFVLKRILAVTEQLAHFKDLDSVLDHILYEARSFTGADSGSIYLVRDNQLFFSYVHNDTLFKKGEAHKHLYSNSTITLDNGSIAGQVAVTGQPLNFSDVYQLPKEISYTFNTEFDRATGYRTRSMLTVPLIGSEKRIVGVMSLINAMDEKDQVGDFSHHDELFATTLAFNATVAIDRAIMNRDMILRMLATSRLRDPMETGPHVNRVGAYSAELYQHWAMQNGTPYVEMKKNKDTLRLAAMLHDIGKVAISDLILKKPARLTTEEFSIMKGHTIYGARLFGEGTSALDKMSGDIALSHHERWDGTGYPGNVEEIDREPITMGKGKNSSEISIFGSIVAIADVYDALSAHRVYKDPWPQEQVLDEIKKGSGSQFNPDVVGVFFDIYEVINAIRQKYTDV